MKTVIHENPTVSLEPVLVPKENIEEVREIRREQDKATQSAVTSAARFRLANNRDFREISSEAWDDESAAVAAIEN